MWAAPPSWGGGPGGSPGPTGFSPGTQMVPRLALFFLPELDVPIAHVNEMLPAFVGDSLEVEIEVRAPQRLLRRANGIHPRLFRGTARLSGVAVLAATDKVFPGGFSAEVARDDVVEVEVSLIHDVATILAGIFVPGKNVLAGQLHLFLRGLAVEDKKDYGRNRYPPIDAVNELELAIRLAREIAPIVETERSEGAVLLKDRVRVALTEHADSPASGADVHRLPEPIEHEDIFSQGV